MKITFIDGRTPITVKKNGCGVYDLSRANLTGANLSGADLSDANLRGAYLSDANLSDADLRGAYLCDANLRGANLRGADLSDANLSDANLRGADLSDAYLSCADLSDADLRGAYLCDANLFRAYLAGSVLCDANLSGADLRGADLRGAYMRDANLTGANLPKYQVCPEVGGFYAWKKLRGGIVAKIYIPSTARRTSSLVGRKCRADKACFVWSPDETITEASSMYRDDFVYTLFSTVNEPGYDPDIRVECTAGIHFFMTRREAEEFSF